MELCSQRLFGTSSGINASTTRAVQTDECCINLHFIHSIPHGIVFLESRENQTAENLSHCIHFDVHSIVSKWMVGQCNAIAICHIHYKYNGIHAFCSAYQNRTIACSLCLQSSPHYCDHTACVFVVVFFNTYWTLYTFLACRHRCMCFCFAYRTKAQSTRIKTLHVGSNCQPYLGVLSRVYDVSFDVEMLHSEICIPCYIGLVCVVCVQLVLLVHYCDENTASSCVVVKTQTKIKRKQKHTWLL